MKQYKLSTGRVLMFDICTLAEFKPAGVTIMEGKEVPFQQQLRLEFPGNVFAICLGREADEMLALMK